MVHRTEEALIKVESLEMVLQGAMHEVNQAVQITVEEIFRSNEPSYLLTAAVFGLAPNLVTAGH